MSTKDTSQTTRARVIAGRTLNQYHKLNPFSPQGGRFTFPQSALVYEVVGKVDGTCCSSTTVTAPATGGGGGGGGGTYIVTYLGNTNTGGSVPVDGSSPYSGGSSVTILGNSGTLTRSGAVFAGWNTAADGSGIKYVGGDTFNITQNTTLYAQWISAGSRLRYNAGTGGSGTAPSSSGTYYTPYSTADIVGNTGSFSNGSLVFGGWNTAADGSGTSYPPGSDYIMPATGNVDLYAQWINPTTTYTLTYDANASAGGSGTAPAPPTLYSSKAPATIVGNTGPFVNSDPTKIFYGWNTAANGTGTSYPAGSTITMNADKTLYAQWVTATPEYTVTYFGNGSTGGAVPAPPTNYPGGVQATILGQATLTRPGYAFLGWNTAADGTGSVYLPTSSVVINANLALYAQWAPGAVIKDCGSFTGAVSIPSIYLSGGRTVYRDTVTNTITITIPTFYSNNGAPYGIGNGPTDNGGHSGNLKSTYATATLSQVAGVYQIDTTYTAAYTGGTYTQTSTLALGSTYWPTSETIASVSIPFPNNPATFQFDPAGTNISVGGGCFGGASFSSGTTTQNSVISFYINFSNGTSTRVALGTQQRWTGTTNTYTYVFNYTRAELANGPTPSPLTGTFTPVSSTGVNTPNV
jgi:uncharacterized repeat protein (TIGR02543 family)